MKKESIYRRNISRELNVVNRCNKFGYYANMKIYLTKMQENIDKLLNNRKHEI